MEAELDFIITLLREIAGQLVLSVVPLFFSALPCYNLTVDHSNATLIEAEWYTNLTVMCEVGYELDDGNTSFTTMCLTNRTWTHNLTCNGKAIFDAF